MDSSPNLSGELFVEYVVQLMTPSPRAPPNTPAPPGPVVQTEDVLMNFVDTQSLEPFGASDTVFNAGISPQSDNIVQWASSTAIQFLSDFYGTVAITFTGVGATAGVQWLMANLGNGTTASVVDVVSQTISDDQTTINILATIGAFAGQYVTVYDLFSFASLISTRLIVSVSKQNVHF